MYLNLIQIAESFGVSETTVEDWIRNEGLPHTRDRSRLLFDRNQVAIWATARGLAAQAGFLAPENPAFSAAWQLGPLLRAGGIWRDVPAAGVVEVFARIVGSLPGSTPPIREFLAQQLSVKRGVTYAPVGVGFALPHLKTRVALGRDSGTVALILLRDALTLEEPCPDAVPVTRLMFFIAPSPRAHLDILGRLSRIFARGPLREMVAAGAKDDEILQAVDAADASASGAAVRAPS